MKIGFDAKRAMRNFTGLGNYSRFVINNLARFYPENDYVLFTSALPGDEVKSEISSSPSISYAVKERFSPLWRSFGITKDIRDSGVQIYHGLSAELPFGIERTKVKSVVTIHDLIFRKFPKLYQPVDRLIYDYKARYACRHADRIIAVSECTKRDVVEAYGIDPNKIEVIYQGCFPIFRERADEQTKKDVARRYDLSERFVLSIGSIEERKNILLVVKALKQLPGVHFVAIGKQTEYALKVAEYAHESGVGDRVHILSGVPLADLPVILQLSEIFVYPSLYEGFGIPVIEALSCGIPVIAATGSCLEEAGGPNSLYVDPHDEDDMAAKIKMLMDDRQMRQRMSMHGVEYVQRFSDQNCTEAMMAFYERLLGE